MLNLLFSPNGRISSSQMITAGLILIVVGLIPSALFLFGVPELTTTILGWLTYVLAVPWIFIWMKRYRDGGQSPVMCLVAIAVYCVLYLILMAIFVGGDFVTMFSAGMEAGANDPEAMEAAMEDAIDLKSIALKSMMAGALTSLITLFGLNALIKHKPETSADTFA